MENEQTHSNRFKQFGDFTRYYLKFAGGQFYTLQALEFVTLFTKNLGLVSILPLLAISGFVEWTPPEGILKEIANAATAIPFASSMSFIIVLYVALTSVNHVISYFKGQLSIALNQRFHMHLRSELYGKMLHAEWSLLLTKHNAQLTHTYMADLGRVQNSGRNVIDLLKSVISAIIVTVLAGMISWQLTLVGIAAASIGVVLQILFTRRMHQNAIENRQNARQLFTHMMESLAGLKLVKAFANEQSNLERFRAQSEESSRITITQSRHSAQQALLKGILTSIFIAGFIAIALPFLNSDGLLLGLFFIVLGKVNGAVQAIITNSRQIITNLPSFDAYQGFLDELDTASETALDPSAEKVLLRSGIRLKKVSFSYRENSDRPALHNLSLEIPALKTTAIQGPSGAGKTTLMDTLLGLLKPSEGEVWIDDNRLQGDLRARWRSSIAYIPQEPFLFNESIGANMRYFAPDATDEEIWSCLKIANAHQFVGELDNGLETIVGDRGTRLSGGERQRLTLARALMRKPQVLFLDEATSNLDYLTEAKIQKAIERLHGSITIIIISHRRESIQFADHVFEIESGNVRQIR